MPRTPDRSPGVSDEEGVILETTASATQQGEIRYDGSSFSFYDGVGEYDPRTGGGGISAAQHKVLRQLIHLAEHGGPWDAFSTAPYWEPKSGSGPWDYGYTWWESSSKTNKIVEKTINRDSSIRPTTIVWVVYDTDGSTALVTATDTYAYSGSLFKPTSITRTFV